MSSRQRDAQQHPASCSRVHQELSTAPLLAQDSSEPAESYLQAGLSLPQDSQELGPWEEQGAWSPLNLDYRNETWRRMLEEGLQLPYGAARCWGEGLLPLCSPPPKILQAWYRYMNRSSSQGAGTDFPSSALAQLWRKGSAPGSLLNYSLLKGGRGAVRVRLLLSPASQGCLYPFHHFHG